MSQVTVAQPILEMRGITKHFPGLLALDDVAFSVQPGEIHALLGQNGAGKSTLMKILAGVHPVDAGEILIGGQPAIMANPRAALKLGVGTVYQDLSLVPHLSVADNMFLGREPGGGFFVQQGAIHQQSADLLRQLGVKDIDPRVRVSMLPLAQQQLVEIARVLAYQPRILVLDEPTAALAEEETALLFNLLKGLRSAGIAIIFISHRFKEVLEHCDRATILRNGKLIKTLSLREITEDELIELTIGEKLDAYFSHEQDVNGASDNAPILEVENLRVGRTVNGVNLQLRRGEIVGITGLLGAGQNALARALFGIQPAASGVIRRNGQPVRIESPQAAIHHGIGLLTEHRKREGLVLAMSISENITLPSLPSFRQIGLFINDRRERAAARTFIDQLRIKASSPRAKVSTLSGGNQQKVILGKWLLRDLEVLVFISPTQGVDVGAKAEIYHELSRLARAGKAILVISEESVEILGVSDRILVMYKGHIVQEFERRSATEEALTLALQGSTVKMNGNTHG